MECEQCKLKDELIRDRQASAEWWMERADALEAELDHINKMTWWERLFGWPWDKKYKHIELVRRD